MSKDIDVFMMAVFSGRERTLHEFHSLITKQGLAIVAIQNSMTGLSIIEVGMAIPKGDVVPYVNFLASKPEQCPGQKVALLALTPSKSMLSLRDLFIRVLP